MKFNSKNVVTLLYNKYIDKFIIIGVVAGGVTKLQIVQQIV